jgi:hypothetical protein
VAGPGGAAARMGIKQTTLISRMKKLGIDPRTFIKHAFWDRGLMVVI